MDHTADFARLAVLEFRLTPRRREVLYHIAYEPIAWVKVYAFISHFHQERWNPVIIGGEVAGICHLLRAGRMIRWPLGTRDIWITPFGMEVLLNGLQNKILETDLPIQQDVVLSDKSPKT